MKIQHLGSQAFPDNEYAEGLSKREYMLIQYRCAALAGLKANPHAWEEMEPERMIVAADVAAQAMLALDEEVKK